MQLDISLVLSLHGFVEIKRILVLQLAVLDWEGFCPG